MAEAPEKDAQGDEQPAAVQQGASSRRTVTMVSLAALAIIGAAVANSFPKFDRFALADFDHFSLPKFDLSSLSKIDHLSLPDFSLPNFSWPDVSWPDFNLAASPNASRIAAQPPQKTAPPAMPDPMIVAALTEIQVSQRQAATVLASLTESSAAQQAELKRISRQVTLLTVQVDTLRGAVTLTTSAIPMTTSSNPIAASSNPMVTSSDPMTTSSIPTSNARTRMVRTSRKTAPPAPPPLPKPVGPVSVGGAPLSPAPAPASGA